MSSAFETRGIAQGSELAVERTDIRFRDVAPRRVRIEVTVHNRGRERSQPQPLELQAAPLGAFLPWRPLARLRVPAIEPGHAAVVAVERPRPRVRAVADFSGFVPGRLLTALGTPDEGRGPSDSQVARNANAVRGALLLHLLNVLPPDLLEVLGRKNLCWAGNINVLVGNRAVERHMARALRIYPGRANLAMFLLGAQATSYALRVSGSGTSWPNVLYDEHEGILKPAMDGSFELPQHWPVERTLLLGLRPPADSGPASVEVHVQRRPQGDEAVVEFAFDPAAAGPGCYTV